MKKSLTTFAIASVLVMGFAGSALAQNATPATPATPAAPGTPDPGHPRINEVQKRIDNQQNRVDQGVSDGQINAKQAKRDDAKISREQKSLNTDEAKDNGHITKGEQKNLNKRLNKGSKRIHHQRKDGAKAGAATTTTP